MVVQIADLPVFWNNQISEWAKLHVYAKDSCNNTSFCKSLKGTKKQQFHVKMGLRLTIEASPLEIAICCASKKI
jgi:hypothetical protein